MFLLLSYCIIAGVMAEDLSVVHYQQENSSVCLHVSNPPPHKNAYWRFTTTVIFSSTSKINPIFKEKVDYTPGNHTLCLKRLSDRDSGIYEFSFESNFTLVSEKHKIIVQEMLPQPVIKMSVLDANVSVAVCNISINCSIWSDWLWSFCDMDGCKTSQASLAKVSITVSTDNSSVVCRGNNSVSSVSESIAAACFRQSNLEHKEALQSPLVIVIALALCLCLLAFLVFMVKKLLPVKNDQTSTAQLIRNQQVQAQTHPGTDPWTDRQTSSSCQTDAFYENMNSLPPSQTRSIREDQGSTPSQNVDTVYSVLQPTKVNLSHRETGDKVTNGPETTHWASTSPSVTWGKAGKIESVYSMVQKPKYPPSQHQ